MKKLRFTKMEGCGNDYVYVDCTGEDLTGEGEISRRVSDRHFGIGSDGLILIRPSETCDFRMSMYNADGSEGSMCGNGIRCVGKYVYDHGLTSKTEITVETRSGVKKLSLHPENGKVQTVTVDMGSPILSPREIPVLSASSSETIVDQPLLIEGREWRITCVSMGNPHCVVFVPENRDLPLEELGPKFELNPMFPDRINTEFIKVMGREELSMRVWERGSGETLACGTGACAAVVAAALNGKTEDTATVHLLGGDLRITWEREANRVLMEGPAVEVFTGEISL